MSSLFKHGLSATAAAIALLASSGASAAVTWVWSFGGEAGTFSTTGNAPLGAAPAGTYQITDFSVTQSNLGNPLGSLLGGEYADVLGNPDFVWSGNNVTGWHTAGPIPYLYFSATGYDASYFFGWNGQINPQGAGATHNEETSAFGLVAIEPLAGTGTGAVPEPEAWMLLIAGFGLIGTSMRRVKARLRYA